MVAAFALCNEEVLLVRKEKPKWQSGLLNGVGGKAEVHETPLDAMCREFLEETNIEVSADRWNHFASEFGRGYVVHFFRCRLSTLVRDVTPTQNDAGEKLYWYNARMLDRQSIIGNLQWLIPLAVDPRGFNRPVIVDAIEDIKENPTW
jgi:8-oxo-dGTP diphosphatase